MDLTPQDVLAAVDVLNEITERSDNLELDEAIAFKEAAEQLKAAVGKCLSLLETQLRQQLEGQSRQVGTRLYTTKADGKWRPEHDVIRAKLISRCSVDGNGEIRRTADALSMMWDLMKALYIEPSKMPKTGGLDKLNLDKSDVSHWEKTGTRIEVVERGGPE
jgi:hypothetical protein